MLQFVPCNGCGSPIPTPELADGKPAPHYLICQTCKREVFWDIGFTDNFGPLVLYSIEDSTKCNENEWHEKSQRSNKDTIVTASGLIPTPQLELELMPTMPNENEPPIDNTDTSLSEATVSDDMEVESESATDWSLLGPVVVRERRREVSAIRKVIPPILGGLAAFPIATLIMWYGFGRDIGSTGPTVARYVPWIVPPKLRSNRWEDTFPEPERSAISTNRTRRLPSLPREVMELPSPVEKLPSDKDEPNALESELALVTDASVVALPSISETIADLRKRQTEWDNTPESDRVRVVGEFYTSMKQLSEQAASLKGRSATVWRKELEEIAKEILAHTNIPKAIRIGSTGKLAGVPAASPNGFMATVLTFGEEDVPNSDASWKLKEFWMFDDNKVPIEILPGALPLRPTTSPWTCLVLGKLVTIDLLPPNLTDSDSLESKFVLNVHCALPK